MERSPPRLRYPLAVVVTDPRPPLEQPAPLRGGQLFVAVRRRRDEGGAGVVDRHALHSLLGPERNEEVIVAKIRNKCGKVMDDII